MNPAFGPSLRKEVVFTIVINQAIEIIHPTLLTLARIQPVHGPLTSSKMKLRTQGLPVKRLGNRGQPLRLISLDDICHVNVTPITGRFVNDLHLRVLVKEFAHIPAGGGEAVASP